MDGVKLAALFSYMPNKLEYCGPENVSNIFYDHLRNDKARGEVKELLIKFEALYPYLKIISEKNNKDPFDYDIVEAYWLGNKLSWINKQDIIKLIELLTKRGLMDSIAKKLIKKIGKLDGEIPLTHLFHIIFVGVGAVTGKVPTIIENMDKCRISWGTICEVNDAYLIVEYNKLKKQGKYFIDDNIEKLKIDYDKNFFNNLKVRDKVAIHWGSAVKKLDSRELKNLKDYTQKVIELTSKL